MGTGRSRVASYTSFPKFTGLPWAQRFGLFSWDLPGSATTRSFGNGALGCSVVVPLRPALDTAPTGAHHQEFPISQKEKPLHLGTNLPQAAPGSGGVGTRDVETPKKLGDDPASGHQAPRSLPGLPAGVELIVAVKIWSQTHPWQVHLQEGRPWCPSRVPLWIRSSSRCSPSSWHSWKFPGLLWRLAGSLPRDDPGVFRSLLGTVVVSSTLSSRLQFPAPAAKRIFRIGEESAPF